MDFPIEFRFLIVVLFKGKLVIKLVVNRPLKSMCALYYTMVIFILIEGHKIESKCGEKKRTDFSRSKLYILALTLPFSSVFFDSFSITLLYSRRNLQAKISKK